MPLLKLGKNLCLLAHEQGISLSLERQKKQNNPTQNNSIILSSVEIHNFGFMFHFSGFYWQG